MERKYYRATPGGKSFEACKIWQELSRAASEKGFAIAKEFGANAIFKVHDRIVAMTFDCDPGRGWVPAKVYGETVYKPDKRTKTGKDIFRKIVSVNVPTSFDFCHLLGGGDFVVSGNRWSSAGFYQFGDDYVVSVPIGERISDEFIPPDSVPLKMSEYWAMKEAAEENGQKDSK